FLARHATSLVPILLENPIAFGNLGVGHLAPLVGRQHETVAARIEFVQTPGAVPIPQLRHLLAGPDLAQRRLLCVADLVGAVPVGAARKNLAIARHDHPLPRLITTPPSGGDLLTDEERVALATI